MSGNKRILFLDPRVIGESENVRLTVNPPSSDEVVIRADKSWEECYIAFYLSVVEEQGLIRMWYTCRDGRYRPNVAYAESRDGLHFEKPDLGIVDYEGSTANNLVGVPHFEGSVVRDPHAASDRRFMYVPSEAKGGFVRYYSEDGLAWSRQPGQLMGFASDTQNVVCWDERLSTYVFYVRMWIPGPESSRRRAVGRMTAASLDGPIPISPSGDDIPVPHSDRLPHFTSEVPVVYACDSDDPENTDVYTMVATRYPIDERYHIAFPTHYALSPENNQYVPKKPEGPYLNDGRIEIHFAGGVDGVDWHRYDRRPYVRSGCIGSETAEMVFMGYGLIPRGDEIWQYGTGYRTSHGGRDTRLSDRDGVILRYVQRVDGYVSADTDHRGGSFTTAPVACTGAELLLNADTGATGSVRVGVLSEDGRSLQGLSVDKCLPVRTNDTGARVRWSGDTDLASIVGRTVRLRVRSVSAKLYSARFKQGAS